MKKRKVMALLLAVALAVPNAGIVPGMANVQAASIETKHVATSESIEVGQEVTWVDPDTNVAQVQKELDGAVFDKVLLQNTTLVNNWVKGSEQVDEDTGEHIGTWSVQCKGSDALSRGKNEVTVRFTFDKSQTENVSGNGWKKEKDQYYHDFVITVEAVEMKKASAIGLDKASAWPELTEKSYAAGTTVAELWKEDVEKVSNEYGTFSI